MYGKPRSEATKLKISEAQLGEKSSWYGRKHKMESKQKTKDATSGENHYFFGKRHPQEVLDKISAASKEMWRKRKLAINSAGSTRKLDPVIAV
jgi:hypothetical protein